MNQRWYAEEAHEFGGFAATWCLLCADDKQSDRLRDNARAWAVHAARIAGHFGMLTAHVVSATHAAENPSVAPEDIAGTEQRRDEIVK